MYIYFNLSFYNSLRNYYLSLIALILMWIFFQRKRLKRQFLNPNPNRAECKNHPRELRERHHLIHSHKVWNKCCVLWFFSMAGNRPFALRGHVTNASLKQSVVILLPKIDRTHKNYLTPEIWEETHLREIFYVTFNWFFNKVVWFVLAAVGGHTLALQHGGRNFFLLILC